MDATRAAAIARWPHCHRTANEGLISPSRARRSGRPIRFRSYVQGKRMMYSRSLSVFFALSMVSSIFVAGRAGAVEAAAKAGPSASKSAAVIADSLSVMSMNLEHRDKPEEMRAMAENLKTLKRLPDFILCQEVYFERHGSAEHPQDNTAAVLGDYLGYYCKGTKRTSDREGIAILSKYPFDHYESINLKSQTMRLLLGFRRVSIMGEFTVPGVGKVRVTDTHLTNWEFESRVRNRQISQTLGWIAEREKVAPAVLNFFGGDFNAKYNWDEMDPIKFSGIRGGLTYHDYNGSDNTQGSYGSPNKRIDYIFVAMSGAMEKALRFSGEELLWKDGLKTRAGDHFYPSDHLGVVHSYKLPAVAAPAVAGTIRTANAND